MALFHATLLTLLILEGLLVSGNPLSCPRSVRRQDNLPVLRPHAAGIDIGSDFHVAAVSLDDALVEIHRFGACTADLHQLADWLTQHGVVTVAMESTGVYWIALYDLLETKGFEVLLVDPRQLNRVPGRPKSDPLDAQWIRRLHSYGLLNAAFRPEERIRVLRSYLRHRGNLVRYASHHIQHMQKALEQMNVKLTEAVSDVTGKTGMRIIKAILEGERNPSALATLRDPRCKQDPEQIGRALQGTWREEHLFELKQAVSLYEYYHLQIADSDRQIESHLEKRGNPGVGTPPASATKGARAKKPRGNSPAFDVRGQLYRMAQVDLTAIEGIEETTALTVLSEVGTDLSKWPTSGQFCSWLGLCPQVKQSAGKILSSKVRPGPNRAAQALRLAANSLQSSKSAMGSFFRRIASRAGRAKAVTATAHKLARLVYALLKNGRASVAKGMEEYEEQYKQRVLRSLTRKAEEMGYELKEKQATEAKG